MIPETDMEVIVVPLLLVKVKFQGEAPVSATLISVEVPGVQLSTEPDNVAVGKETTSMLVLMFCKSALIAEQ